MTREDWLNQVAERMRPMFTEAGAELPRRFRITMSLTRRSKAIGVWFDWLASADGAYEILVRLDQYEPVQVAAILAHELVHAAVGVDKGYGAAFGKVARALGLEGKLTATVAGEAFVEEVGPLLEEVGPFPHAPLDWAGPRSGPKKQSARLLKVECEECGLVVRQTRKWIEEVGPAHCPAHGQMQVAYGGVAARCRSALCSGRAR